MSDENKPPPTQTAMPFAQPTQAAIPAQVMDEIVAARRQASEYQAELKRFAAEREEAKATLAKLTEQIQLTDRAKTELEAARRADAIRSAAQLAAVKHGSVSDAQVVKLILEDLATDETGKVVAKADPKIDVDAYVAKFLSDNPHLAAKRVAQGSGTSPYPSPGPAAAARPDFDMRTDEGRTASLRYDLLAMAARSSENPARTRQ